MLFIIVFIINIVYLLINIKILSVFFLLKNISYIKTILIPIKNIKTGIDNKLYLIALIKFKLIIDLKARVNPQAGHDIFRYFFIRQFEFILFANIK